MIQSCIVRETERIVMQVEWMLMCGSTKQVQSVPDTGPSPANGTFCISFMKGAGLFGLRIEITGLEDSARLCGRRVEKRSGIEACEK